MIVLHEDTHTSGFGAEIAATIAEEAFESLDAPVVRVTSPDSPVPFSPPLEKAFLPQVEDVAAAIEKLSATEATRIRHMSTGTVVDVVMPQMGVSVSEGTITRWAKQVGDTIEADETIVEISTDKVDTEVPSPATGVVREILADEGETVPVNTRIAVIDSGGAGATAGAEPAEPPQRRPPRRPPRRQPSPRAAGARPRLPRRLRPTAARHATATGRTLRQPGGRADAGRARPGHRRRSRHRHRRPRDQEGRAGVHRDGGGAATATPHRPPPPPRRGPRRAALRGLAEDATVAQPRLPPRHRRPRRRPGGLRARPGRSLRQPARTGAAAARSSTSSTRSAR